MKTFGYLAPILLVTVRIASGADYAFTPIQFPDATYTIPHGINDDGDVVGSYILKDFDPAKGFIFIGGVYQDFSMPDTRMSLPWGINRKDRIVGTYVAEVCPCEQLAFLCDPKANTWTSIDAQRADSINNRGHIVGYHSVGPINQQVYIYKNGVITSIVTAADFPGLLGSAATGINNKDWVVGYYFFDAGPCCVEVHGFLKKGKQVFTVDTSFADSIASFPLGINNAGDIVGEDTTSVGITSWIYHRGEFSEIAVPGASSTMVVSINNKGQILGWSFQDGKLVGFIGTPGKKKRAPEGLVSAR